MTITLGGGLGELNLLVGADFPDADEDALRRCAGAWAATAASMYDLNGDLKHLGARVLDGLGGEAGEAFAELWQRFSASDGAVEQLAAACGELARACEAAAVEVEYAKIQYIAALVVLGITLAALAAAVWAGGVSALGMPAAVAAAQFTIRLVLTRLVTAIVGGAAVNVSIDAATQAIQTASGHRDEWDWAKTRRAAEDGAIFGLAGGAIFLGGARLAPGAMSTPGGLFAGAGLTGLAGGIAAPAAHGEQPAGRELLLAVTSGIAGVAGPDLVSGRLSAPQVSSLPGPGVLTAPDLSRISALALAGSDASGGSPGAPATGSGSALPDPASPNTPVALVDAPPRAQPEAAGGQDAPVGAAVLAGGPAGAPPGGGLGGGLGGTSPMATAAPSAAAPADLPSALPAGAGAAGPGAAGPALGTAPPALPGPATAFPAAPAPAAVAAAAPAATGGVSAPAHPGAAPPTGVPAATSGAVGSTTHAASSAASAPPPIRPDSVAPADATPAERTIGPADRDGREPDVGDDGATPLRAVTDEQAVTLVRATVFDTDAGLAFYPAGDEIRDFARAVRPTEGCVTLDLHGSPDGFVIDDHLLRPEQFARALRELHSAGILALGDGTIIKLLSCDTAVGGVDSPAARLARELGTEVIAPDQPVWTTLDGDEVVASPVLSGGVVLPADPPDGHWQFFDPTGTVVSTLDIGDPATRENATRAGPDWRSAVPRAPDLDWSSTTLDPGTLVGLDPADIIASIPPHWHSAPSRAGGGIVFADPDNRGRQIRIMPGYPPWRRPDSLTHGPYAELSQNGVRVKVALFGNPTLGA